MIFAGIRGYLDDLKKEDVGNFESGFLKYLDSYYHDALMNIRKEKLISVESEEKLKEAH